MKKIILLFLSSLLISGVVSAASLYGEYKGHQIIKVTSNGTELKQSDVPAVMLDGRTVVPISLLRQLGATVNWDGSKQTVSVELPKQSNDKQKYAILADYYIELRDLSEYIKSFINLMDYFQTHHDGKITMDDLLKEYQSNYDAITKSYNDYLEVAKKVQPSIEAYVQLKALADATKTYSDALVKLGLWEKSFTNYPEQTDKLLSDYLNLMSDGDKIRQQADLAIQQGYRTNMDMVIK